MTIPTLAFGRTGHASTRVIFGAAALARSTAEDAGSALGLLLEYGINHIDTAAGYGRSERLVGAWMPDHRHRFFLATKTGERTYDAARAQIRRSLERLQTTQLDHIQLHNLVDPDEWATAMGPGGALEAVIEARDEGLVRFIGVTGHGVGAPGMHLRSLERFAFDAVLLPYNYTMMKNPAYAADFEELASACEARRIALQTIKGITLGPWNDREHTHSTWYEPLTRPEDISLAVCWVLGRAGTFLNTVGDVSLLPAVFEAASRTIVRPSPDTMDALAVSRGMTPLFV